MTSPTQSLIDARKIFFHLEDDILSVAEYAALVVHLTSQDLEPDEQNALLRVAMQMQDHANAVRAGFRSAFAQPKGGDQ
jgi:hypothetical protein